MTTDTNVQYAADTATDSYLEFWDLRAKEAYDTYGDSVGWKNFAGQPMPTWSVLPRRIRAAWCLSTEKLLSSTFSLKVFFDQKKDWSTKTFGPRYSGVIDHLKKELKEIELKPSDLREWVDLVLLGLDGAWRFAGADGKAFVEGLVAKQEENLNRKWPDWRTLAAGEVSEHIDKDNV